MQEWMGQSVKDRNMANRRGNPLAILGVPGVTVITTATTIVYDNLEGADEYQFVLDLDQASASSNITARLRLDGVAITSGYDYITTFGNATSASSSGATAQPAWTLLAGIRVDKHIRFSISRLNDLARTSYEGGAWSMDATTNPLWQGIGGRQTDTLARNGIEFNVSTGTVTGISVLRRVVYRDA